MTSQPPRDASAARSAVILGAIGLQAAYFTFRALTLDVESAAGLGFSLVVLAAEGGLGLSLSLILFELWRRPAPGAADALTHTSTDVVLVVDDEEIALVRASLAACERLESPHQTLILDRIGRADVRAAAEESGVGYFHPVPTAASRGQALDAALPRLAGELLVVFDAGAIPEPNFLSRTAAQLQHQKTAGVQTSVVSPVVLTHASPRAMAELSPRGSDPLERARQVGRDARDAATFGTSAFLVRRAALDAAGGFGVEAGESLRLSLRLHAHGWQTRYLDEPLCVDFTSRDAARVIGANAAASATDLGVMLSEYRTIVSGLPAPQRLCYSSILVRAASPLFRAVLYVSPLAVLALGLAPAASRWQVEVGVAAVAYHVAASLVRRHATGGRVRVIAHELNALAAVWASCFAILACLLGRRDKVRSDHVAPAPASARPHVLFVSAAAAALLWAWMGAWFRVTPAEALIVPTVLVLWSSGLALVAIERMLAKWDRRRYERRSALLSVQYDVLGQENLGGLGLAFDLSEGGLGLVTYHPFNIGHSIFLTLEGPDGRMRLQGEVRSVRRVGSGVVPGLDRPAAYRVGVLLTRATSQQRDLLLHWSALQAARDVKRSLYDESLRNLFERAPLLGQGRRKHHVPLLLGGDGEDAPTCSCVTQDIGRTGFRVFSRNFLDPGTELRYAMATPFGPASGWVRLDRQLPLTEGPTPIFAQEFSFTIWDDGAEAVLTRMTSPRRQGASLGEALSPVSPPPKLPLRTYAVAAAVWFLLAAPLLSMTFFHSRGPEILLARFERSKAAPTPKDLDELESYSRRLLAGEPPSSERLEQLHDVLSRGARRREAARVAEALVARLPNSAYWRLQWGEGLAAAGLYVDAERELNEALRLAGAEDSGFLASVHAARGRNWSAAGRWRDAASALTQAVFLAPDQPRLRRELASALIRAGRPEEARDYADSDKTPHPAPQRIVAGPTPAPSGAGVKPAPGAPQAGGPPPSGGANGARGKQTSSVQPPSGISNSITDLRVVERRLLDALAFAEGPGTSLWRHLQDPAFDDRSWQAMITAVEAEGLLASGKGDDARSTFRRMVGHGSSGGPLPPALVSHAAKGYFQACLRHPAASELVTEARQVSGRLLQGQGGDVDALSIAAEFFSRAGDQVEAIALLDRAHRVAPNNQEVGRRLAALLEQLGELNRAAEILKGLLTESETGGAR